MYGRRIVWLNTIIGADSSVMTCCTKSLCGEDVDPRNSMSRTEHVFLSPWHSAKWSKISNTTS